LVYRQQRYSGYGGALWDKNKVYSCLLFEFVGGDLTVGIEEGGESSGCCTNGVVNLVQSMCVTGLVSEDSDQFKGSMATTSALGRRSLCAHARRLPDCHEQYQAGSSRGAAVRRRLALLVVVVIRWSRKLNVIFIIFGVLVILVNLYNKFGFFSHKKL
jgi:hypothetical protein